MTPTRQSCSGGASQEDGAPPPLIDTHCHLDMLGDQRAAIATVLQRAAAAGVTTVITIGIDEASSQAAVDIARHYATGHGEGPAAAEFAASQTGYLVAGRPRCKEEARAAYWELRKRADDAADGVPCDQIRRYANVWATVGVHPHDAAGVSEEAWRRLTALARDPRVVAWGEIGMDLAKRYSPPDAQEEVFRRQLRLAADLDLPVVIHDREAHDQVLAILDEEGVPARGGVMHCFSGDVALARRVLDRGLLLSIPGVVTFKNGEQLREVVRFAPLDRLLLETDAPFLAPVPFRGKRNEPALLLHTARMVAATAGVTLAEVARQTTATARRFFRLSDEPQGGSCEAC